MRGDRGDGDGGDNGDGDGVFVWPSLRRRVQHFEAQYKEGAA